MRQQEDEMNDAELMQRRTVVAGPRRYDGVSMTLHWLTLLFLIALFGTVWAREHASDSNAAAQLLALHRSAGAFLWAITLVRLAWKAIASRASQFPSAMPWALRWAARGNEYALYLLLVAQPVTGFVQSIARGKPFTLLGLSIPAVAGRDKAVAHLFHNVHETTATLLLLLVGLHVGAALLHGIALRDGVLGTMLPGSPRLFRK